VFIEVSGSSAAVSWIFEVAPLRSRIVLASTYLQEVSLNPFLLEERELDVVGAHQPKCPQDPSLFYPYNRTFNTHFIFDALRSGRLRVHELCDGLIAPEQVLPFFAAVRDKQARLRQPIIRWE
jgi:threonine dehydrogenase-like Zn-dependent dehydrogenase